MLGAHNKDFYSEKVWDSSKQFMYYKTVCSLKFAILPHRCEATGKRIWWKYAYRITRQSYDFEELVFKCTWMTKEDFLVKRMKGEI